MKKRKRPAKRPARRARGGCGYTAAAKLLRMAFYHAGGTPAYSICVQRLCEAG